jgi:membrane-associated phospholipid phosphatase
LGGLGGLAGQGGLGGLGAVGGLAALGLANSPAVGEGLILTRDGIAGTWKSPAATPPELGLEDENNMVRWEPWVRAAVFDFELVSKLGFSQPAAGKMTLSHLDTSAMAPAYRPIASITRPPVALFKKLLVFLDSYADLRGDRAAEIFTQMNGAVAYLTAIPFLQPARTPYTYELLAAALRLANFTEMRFKQALACRRPMEFSPQVQPMILTPSHGSLPSGHATETFISAFVLWMLLRASAPKYPPGPAPLDPYGDVSWGTQLMRLAARVAMNRTVAGVHFPVDSAAGAFLGLTLGQYFVSRCTGAANYNAYEFDGTQFPDPTAGGQPPNDGDFYWTALYDVTIPGPPVALPPYVTAVGAQALGGPANAILGWLWNRAQQEWW